MGKRNKKKRQSEDPVVEKGAEEEAGMVQCPTCDAIVEAGSAQCPECGQEFLVEDAEEDSSDAEPIPEEVADEDEIPEEEPAPEKEADEDEVPEEEPAAEEAEMDDDEEPPKIKKTMLLIGILLLSVGAFGMAGLRLGIIQFILGDPDPYPGIGSVEPMGHIVSSLPFVLGMVTVMFWGIKNNPTYYEMEKQKEEVAEFEADREYESPAEAEHVSDEEISGEFEETLAGLERDLEEDGMMDDLLQDTFAELEEELDAIPIDTMPAPEDVLAPSKEAGGISGEELKSQLAEELRAERCEKMLKAVVILPDDKERLRTLIADGISPAEFAEEIRTAVERRMKKERERDVTADEKAAILEDELVADLAELEGLDVDEDDENLEDEILREIEDLEDL